MLATILGKALCSLIFGYFGLALLLCGISGMLNRNNAAMAVAEHLREPARKFAVFFATFMLTAGSSVVAGAVLLWQQPVLGLAMGVWPALAFLLLQIRSRKRGKKN